MLSEYIMLQQSTPDLRWLTMTKKTSALIYSYRSQTSTSLPCTLITGHRYQHKNANMRAGFSYQCDRITTSAAPFRANEQKREPVLSERSTVWKGDSRRWVTYVVLAVASRVVQRCVSNPVMPQQRCVLLVTCRTKEPLSEVEKKYDAFSSATTTLQAALC